MSEVYRGFASVYDALMYDVDYPGLIEYIDSLVGLEGKTVLDLGCGTGTVMALLHQKGCKVSGMDISPEMQQAAQGKCPEAAVVVGDMTCCDSYVGLPDLGNYDLLVSMLDCMNYIPSRTLLQSAFFNGFAALKSGGQFLFDMNSEYKLSQILGDNFYYDIGEDECYLWENQYDPVRKECRFDLTFFVKGQDGRFDRIDEVHKEYAYTTEQVVDLLRLVGFDQIQVFGDRSHDAPVKEENRIFYLAVKP